MYAPLHVFFEVCGWREKPSYVRHHHWDEEMLRWPYPLIHHFRTPFGVLQ